MREYRSVAECRLQRLYGLTRVDKSQGIWLGIAWLQDDRLTHFMLMDRVSRQFSEWHDPSRMAYRWQIGIFRRGLLIVVDHTRAHSVARQGQGSLLLLKPKRGV